MQMFKQLFIFYINSSIHVALAVFSLTWITCIEFNILFDKALLYFVFFATVTGYNFVKYFSMAKFQHQSLGTWLQGIQFFSFLSFLIMCYYAYHLGEQTLIWLTGLGLLTFFYAMPFIPKSKIINNLRSIEGLKVYVIALVWACVTVILPHINNNHIINSDIILTSLQRFIFIIVLMFPFEIRDLRYDSIKLATIPQRMGVKKTKIVGICLLVLFFSIDFIKLEFDKSRLIAIALISILTGLFLLNSKKEQGKYYSSFWVEGVPILWLVLLLLLS